MDETSVPPTDQVVSSPSPKKKMIVFGLLVFIVTIGLIFLVYIDRSTKVPGIIPNDREVTPTWTQIGPGAMPPPAPDKQTYEKNSAENIKLDLKGLKDWDPINFATQMTIKFGECDLDYLIAGSVNGAVKYSKEEVTYSNVRSKEACIREKLSPTYSEAYWVSSGDVYYRNSNSGDFILEKPELDAEIPALPEYSIAALVDDFSEIKINSVSALSERTEIIDGEFIGEVSNGNFSLTRDIESGRITGLTYYFTVEGGFIYEGTTSITYDAKNLSFPAGVQE